MRDIITRRELNSYCGQDSSLNLAKCRDLLIILYKGGNPAALESLISALKYKSVEVVKILAENNYPSHEVLSKLIDYYENEKNLDTNLKGMLILMLSSLLSKGKMDSESRLRNRFFNITQLEASQLECKNFLTIDLLESMGNLDEPRNIPTIIRIANKCKTHEGHLIASIHAVRKMLNSQTVQDWLLLLLNDPKVSCEVKREIVETLREVANGFVQNYQNEETWPKKGFNAIDTTLDEIGRSSGPEAACMRDLISNYFLAKEDPAAMVIAWHLEKKLAASRKRRELLSSFWDNSDCREWYNGNSSLTTVIDREVEELQKKDPTLEFIKRRKCTGVKYLGPKQAQTTFMAGK